MRVLAVRDLIQEDREEDFQTEFLFRLELVLVSRISEIPTDNFVSFRILVLEFKTFIVIIMYDIPYNFSIQSPKIVFRMRINWIEVQYQLIDTQRYKDDLNSMNVIFCLIHPSYL